MKRLQVMEYFNEEERLEAARERLEASREFDAESGIDYGVGFDALANEVRGDCVIRTTPKPPDGAGGQEIFFSLDQISDYSSLATAMSISISASLKATFGKGSAKVQFLSEQTINQYSIYLLIRVSVKNAPKRMRDVKLTSDAFDLLKSKGSEAFRKRCGDEFIAGLSTGGEFFGIFEIKTEDQTNKQTIEASVRASGALGAWKVGADFKNAIEKVSRTNQIRAVVLQRGGQNTTLPITVDEMINRAINFPANVAGNQAYAILGTFLGYDTLELPDGKNPIDTQQQQDVLLKLASYRLTYLNLLSNIEYILNHPKEFEVFDPLDIQNKANLIRETLNNIAQSASTCFNDYTKCKLLALPALDTSLPSRKADDFESMTLCENLGKSTLSNLKGLNEKIVYFLMRHGGVEFDEDSEGKLIIFGEDCTSLINRLKEIRDGDRVSQDSFDGIGIRLMHAFLPNIVPNLERLQVGSLSNKDLAYISKFSNLRQLAVNQGIQQFATK